MNRKEDWFLKALLFPFNKLGQFVIWLILGEDHSTYYDNVSLEEKQKKDKEFYETFSKHQKPKQ